MEEISHFLKTFRKQYFPDNHQNHINNLITYNSSVALKTKALYVSKVPIPITTQYTTNPTFTSVPYTFGTVKMSKQFLFSNLASRVTWLLPLFCLISLFGRSHAGFACLSNPCVFGVCIDGLNSSYSCYCIDGYTGIQCQTNWDECWSGPCENGGTCIDGVAYYNCTCQDGFSGNNCEENVDECMSNPCQNAGQCRDKNNGYICTCQPGYLGAHCEIDVAVCDADNGARCQNGGECIEGPGLDYSCKCAPGWYGRICQEEINECESAPCHNGGVCVDKLASYACACPMGYTGANCEEEILICADNPCQNNALCLMEEGLNTCYCVPDYHGEKCEYQYDECQLGPRCMNGGVCIDGVDTFSCSCPPLLTGMLCECLMIGEDSLDCNYTSPSTIPLSSTTQIAIQKELTEHHEATTMNTDTFHVSLHHKNESVLDVTVSSVSYTLDSQSSSESSYSSEGSASIEMAVSDNYIPISRFDISQESTTVPSISAGFDSDYTSFSHITDVSTNKEAKDKFAVPQSTFPTFLEFMTSSTSKTPYDFSTIYATMNLSTSSTLINENLSTSPLTSSKKYVHHDSTTLSLPTWQEISTTASPFFTNYPSLYTTPDYNDLSNKYGGASNEYLTTIKPHQSTFEPHDFSNEGDTTVPPIFSTTESFLHKHHHHHHHHHHTTSSTHDYTQMYHSTVQTSTPETYATTVQTFDNQNFQTDDLGLDQFTITTQAPHIAPTETPAEEDPGITVAFTQRIDPEYITNISFTPKQPITEDTEDNFNTAPTSITLTTAYSNISEPDCAKGGCYNGGTCVTTTDGSRCVCRFDRQGALCELPIVIKNAAFSGDSYLSHRIYKGLSTLEPLETILPIHVQLKVRTRATNGLIMLAAAQGTKGGHYMALFLQKGLLQFQFSCGLQTMLLSELETPVNTGHEISIRAELDFSRNYTHCNASLLVNDTLAMSGDQPTWLKLLPPRLHTAEAILNTWLHLGGAPQAPIGLIIELPPAQSGTGFTGCLHSLYINKKERHIFGDAFDGFGITECGSLACLSSPCRNGAACIKIESNEVDENGDKIEKWNCKCPSGYMGPTCETSICEDNPCQYGGTCVQFPGSGYLCLCPLGKHGHYCEHNLEVALPSFSGSVNGLSSFVAYTVPVPLEYSTELSLKILPQTMSQISLLAFLGQSGYHDEKSDHLAVSFIQGYIMLTWNLGAGPRRIFTQRPIDFRLDAPRVPYEIKVGRIGRQAWLSVDGKFNISGRAPGSVSRMDVLPILYIGGHEISNFNTLPHDLPLHSGFQGCIYDVHLKSGQVTVPLQDTRGVRGRGVGQCGTRECHRHACQHDGACLQHGATFTCICQEDWYGPLCAQPINPCDFFNNKCSRDSTCVPLVNGYECDCPVGKTGKNCEEEIRSLSDVSLTGRRSYLSVRWPYLYENNKIGSKRSHIINYRNFTKKLMPPKAGSTPNQHFVMKLLNEVEKQRSFAPVPLSNSKSFEEHHRVQFFFIELQVRPLSERGLLLYFGTLNNNEDRKIGFVSLSLQGGVVEFRISGPSNHVTVVRSVRMLAIGEWHKIKMAQRGRWLTLWVEGSASSALAPSAEVIVEPESLLYVGGLRDLSKLPHNAITGFPIPFRGCVRGLVISGTRVVLNETNIVESRNIRDCDGTACGGDSCEAGGHCWLDENLQPHCICPEYAKGDRCEYSETCKLIPCKNNGRCLRSGRCSCPNGWGGFYCEISMNKPTMPNFRGNSYLILPPPRIPIKEKRKGFSLYLRNREVFQISLNFSTISRDGLLFWSEHDQTTFLGLGLKSGYIKIASNLLEKNTEAVEIPPSGFIADGAWHSVRITLNGSCVELRLDGAIVVSEKFPNVAKVSESKNLYRRNKESSITYEDYFFLGGFPNMESVATRTRGRFDKPFKGCLQDIQFGAEPNAIIKDFTKYEGENIGSCDLHGDEPIVWN